MGNCNTKSYEANNRKNSSIFSPRKSNTVFHEGSILGLATSGSTIATVSDDKRIGVINHGTLSSDNVADIKYLQGHSKAVNRVLYLNSYLWSISRDLSVRQWNQQDGECMQTIADAHTLNIAAIAAHGNNHKHVFTGSRDYSVKGWDVESGKSFVEYKAPRNIVTTMTFGNDENLVLQGSEDLCIRVWDVRQSNTKPAVHITGYVYFPLCMDMHRNGSLLASGCKGFDSVGCEVKLMDMRNTSAFLAELKGHSHDVTGCRFDYSAHDSENHKRLLSCSKDGSVIVRDVHADGSTPVSYMTGKSITSLGILEPSPGVDSGPGPRFALGATDGSLLLMSLQKQKTAAAQDVGQLQLDYCSQEYFQPSETEQSAGEA